MKIIDIDEVNKLYDDLLPWDKASFIEKHIEERSSIGEDELIDFVNNSISKKLYTEDDTSEFVCDHYPSEILSEFSSSELVDYLIDEFTADELSDVIQTRAADNYEVEFLSSYLKAVDPKNFSEAVNSLSDTEKETLISILTNK